MIRSVSALLAIILLMIAPAFAQNSPPVGNNMPVQPTKTGSYTIKQADLKSIIPFNCSSGCTVTFPHSTSSFPKGYPVIIQNVGSSGTVTISATTSTIYGLPLTSGSVALANPGNWAALTADPANNYLAYGFVGTGGGGGTMFLTGNTIPLTGNGQLLLQ